MIDKLLISAALLSLSAAAHADGRARWRVEITNVTAAQTFTPLLAATHSSGVDLFEPGEPASAALATLAEGGDIGPLTVVLEAAGHRVADIQTNGGLLGPGETATLVLRGYPGLRLSLAGMLIPTNDTFVGIDSEFLPVYGGTRLLALAYDAGSEANDQNCANIPGPRCGGEGVSPGVNDGDEGFVHISNGFHELGSGAGPNGEILSPAPYDWKNPVAIVKIQRIRGFRF